MPCTHNITVSCTEPLLAWHVLGHICLFHRGKCLSRVVKNAAGCLLPLQSASGSPSLLTGRKNDPEASTQPFIAVIKLQQQEDQLQCDDDITTTTVARDSNSKHVIWRVI